MDVDKLQQKVAYGLQKAATVTGVTVTQLRPATSIMPTTSDAIAQLKCLIDSSASFSGTTPLSWGHKFAYAAIDTTSIETGDYLLVNIDDNIPNLIQDMFFVARFEPWKPLLIVQTNTTISFLESDLSTDDSSLGYRPPEGPVWEKDSPIASGWRVSMLQAGSSGRSLSHLGTDVSVGTWEILMPAIPEITIHQGLRIQDSSNNCYHVSTVEITTFGLHLTATADQT
ncbi:hypothetical protein [Acetobacter conturbans]|uniref:Uncharacterized protein n=1 Tax=Acetobacter conturbans TaxID=1737472 RepID=A0ABX0K3R9_9PROT|nr:hypothetical protein [Acetobacter conturbans]NHN88865.1 hypothetical protein [Acetobacter conturbans]